MTRHLNHTGAQEAMPGYTATKPPTPDRETLRARIPGWGADLDPADRPSYPRLVDVRGSTGAHWDFPERQPGGDGRERSIEHAFVTPVFGTAQPLHGVSGRIRRLSYDRFSEGRNAHWLLLMGADRVDVVGGVFSSLLRGRPDDPVTETGVLAERHGGLQARLGSSRTDWRHQLLDPVIVVGPWVLAGVGVVSLGRRTARLVARLARR